MRWPAAFCASLLVAATLAAAVPAAPAAAAAPHWAQPAADLMQAKTGWQAPPDLEQPIPPAEWNRLVVRITGGEPGPAPHETDARRYWLWAYTGGMSDGPTIARQDAIGGLMKILNFVYQVDLNGPLPAALETFGDGKAVSDRQQHLVAFAVAQGLVAGFPGWELRPESPLTYGEAAVLAERVLQRYGVAQAPAVPEPLPGNWAGAPVRPDGIISAGDPGGSGGQTAVRSHGAAHASALPRVGPAPAGHLWVLLDVEVTSQSETETLPLATGLRFGLEDPQQMLFRYEMDPAASAAVGSPFVGEGEVLAPGQSLRGLVAFAVPVGTKCIWYHVESALGLGKGKPGFNSGTRSEIGDLPGPERVYPYNRSSREMSAVRVQGVYATAPEAAVITAGARARGIPAWIEAEPDGGYAAIVGFLYFEQ